MSKISELLNPVSICGHEVKKNRCRYLCDDFVEKTPGFCYLLAFHQDYRKSALSSLKLFPRVASFNWVYSRTSSAVSVNVIPPTSSNGLLHIQHGSLPSQVETVKCIGQCSLCGHVKEGYSNTLRPKAVSTCPSLCSDQEDTFTEITMVRFTFFSNKVGSRTPFSNVIKNESAATQFEMRDPTLHISEASFQEMSISVTLSSDNVEIKVGEDRIEKNRYDQRLKAYVHDYVANCWSATTDMELSCIGVEGPASRLTPDYIIPQTKCVLELATCATDNEKSLISAYQKKVDRYKGELEKVGAKFFILVVSPQKVYTNASISQNMVDQLTLRMRAVMPVRAKIIEVLGEDITDDEYSEVERLTRDMFSSMPQFSEIDDKYKYVRGEIEECSRDMTHSEAVSAARILLKQFESTKDVRSGTRKDLEEYMSKFTTENTRNDMKRVCNIPLILPTKCDKYIDGCLEGPESLRKVWCETLTRQHSNSKELSAKEVEEDKDLDKKHMLKRSMMAKVNLDNEEKKEAALSGIGGKAFKGDEEVEEHRKWGKLSFHPLTDTSDIESFVQRDLLYVEGTPNESLPYLLEKAVVESKYISTGTHDLSVDIWKKLMKTDVMKFSMLMSKVFLELAYTYKHWTKHYEFLLKDFGNGVWAVVYNPKSTLFVSFAFPKAQAKVWDTGRLGPELFQSKTHIFTDWSSFDNSQLEHFIKFGPYMGSCIVELLNSSESSLENFSKYARDCTPHILLLYCNNKTDVEELVTSQRYLFMKLLEDVSKSPYTFVDRFPKVLRSRLTSYYLKKTISLLEYYDEHSITKVPKQGEEMILYDYMNIKSLFSDQFITINCKINEFYFGYVVSKERNTGKDKTFKVLTKLIKQEQKFRKNVQGSIFTRNEDYEEFKTNMPLLKFFSQSFSDLIEKKFGKDYRSKIMNDFIHSASRTNFSDLATLKVSSRDHSKEVEIPLGSDSTEKTFQKLREQFPEEIMKRPFCMESMAQTIKKYEADTGKKISHITQLAPWCLNKLLEKGWFDSDQFDKSQHGGEREIHVLEFMARIVQYFVELVSRVICSYFPSETTINPGTKDRFVKEHYAKSKEMFGASFTTISKSADATTWCQFHHSSHFAAMFQAILPEELKTFTLSALSLWPRKRLSFPLKQGSSLAANVKLQTSNEVYMQFKSDFEKGEGMFVNPRGNLLEIISGMFQGILHTTSSLYHTMIQEVMRQVVLKTCKSRLGLDKVLVTVCQGSDDSGCMISFPGKPTIRTMQLAKRLLLWKERVSPFLSVFCNEAKSSIGTHDLIEYNSEWHIRHMVIKPTFRWVSASQELSVTERFIDRFRIYNNMVTECLSGGASTLECSVIQLFQCTMHYTLMGLLSDRSLSVKQRYLELLLENPDPLFGFFPLDDDVSCGVTGVEFLLFKLYKTTSFGTNLKVLGESEMSMDYSPEDLPNWMKTKDLSSIRLKFSNMRVFYRVVERMNLEPLEDAIHAVENDPSILFSRSNSWQDEQHNLVLKVFSKGVKESISNKSSMLRMAASSAYILTNRCFTSSSETEMEEEKVKDMEGKEKIIRVNKKHTLLFLMAKHSQQIGNARKNMNQMKTLFPFYEEFEKIESDINNLKKNSIVIDQYSKRTSKVKIVVIPKPVEEVDVIEMCKRKWFGRGAPSLSQGQFKRKWLELTNKFPFLSDKNDASGLNHTAENLKLNVVQTKMFLESMSFRSRSVVLYDSTSRSGNLSYSLSRMFWPGKKLSVPESNLEDKLAELRCKLFSLLTFWFTREFTETQVKHLIKTDLSLNKSYVNTPSYGLKLRIMKDVLTGENKENIIHRIEMCKKGLLGSFVQVQRGKGRYRKGQGIWQGSVCGIGTRIMIEGNTCESIIVNALYDTVALGWHLNQFMNEASLKMPLVTDVEKAETNCWLTNDGRIVISSSPRGIPIFQDPKMKTVGTEETANMQWQVDVNNNNIRIRARDPSTSQMFTILSDTFTSRDWMTGITLDIDDPVFRKWSSGESVHMPSLESILTKSFPMNRHDFMKQKALFESGKLINFLNWDYKRMQKVMRDSVINRGYKPDEEKRVSDDDSLVADNDTLNRFSSMLQSAIDKFDSIELDEEIEDWAAEVEMEEEHQQDFWGIEMNDLEEEELRNAMGLFQDSSTDEFYELVDRSDLTRNFSMPSTVRFFSALEHLNIIMTKETLRTSLLGGRMQPGVLGVIYSICSGKFMIGRDTDLASEIIEIEDDISNISSSVSRPGALPTLTLEEVRIHIVNLQDQLEQSKGLVSKRLHRLLQMYKDREEEIMMTLEPGLHDLILLNSEPLLTQLLEHFSRFKILPLDVSNLDKELAMNMFMTLLKTFISRSEELSKSEKDDAILNLSNNCISRSVIQTISVCYRVNIYLNRELVNSSTDEGNKDIYLTI